MKPEDWDVFSDGMKKIYGEMKKYHIVESGAEVVKYYKPQYTLIIEGIKQICSLADQMKLDGIIRGLSEGSNIETRMNELYSYVENNREHAFLVSENFRKVMLSGSTITCCIMGVMMADLSSEKRDPTQCETIIMRALDSFTDYDIHYFKEIIDNTYIVQTEDGIKYIDVSTFPEDKKSEYMMTLDFCKQNRIFKSDSVVTDDGAFIADAAIVDNISDMLYVYIDRAKRQMSYGIN